MRPISPGRHARCRHASVAGFAALVLVAGLATAVDTAAQSAVSVVPRPASPYVPQYSLCRPAPPDDPTAQTVFKAMWPSDDGAMRRVVDTLRARPVESLSAVQAEAFFLALTYVGLAFTPPVAEDARPLALVAREHGKRIGERFANDPFVQCARVTAESATLGAFRMKDHFTGQERAAARDEFIAFCERVLRGEVVTAAAPGIVQSAVGQRYLDRGFEKMPDTAAAARDFEAGARHVLDAGASVVDQRHIGDWKRYAFMLAKLPDAQRLEISKRLLGHVEEKWGGKAATTGQALDVYLHVLGVAGDAAFALRQGTDAVSVYRRRLDVAQALRKRDSADPNHQVSEAIAFVLLGDAQRLAGDRRAAGSAYEDARKAYDAANAAAKDMLQFQEFEKELASRRATMR